MNTFHLRILEADSTFFEGECRSLVFPTTDGMVGIQANHSNMVSVVDDGIASFTLENGEIKHAALSDGIIKVFKNDVLVLVNTAEHPEEIDKNQALREAEEAKEFLLQKRSNLAYKAAKEKIARELIRAKLSQYEK